MPKATKRFEMGDGAMADRGALRKIGLGFLAITTSVMFMAAVVVKNYSQGRLSIEGDVPYGTASALIAAR